MRKPIKMSETQLKTIKELTQSGVNSYQIAKRLAIPNAVARYHANKVLGRKSIPEVKTTGDVTPNILDAYNEYKKQMEILKVKFLSEVANQLH